MSLGDRVHPHIMDKMNSEDGGVGSGGGSGCGCGSGCSKQMFLTDYRDSGV